MREARKAEAEAVVEAAAEKAEDLVESGESEGGTATVAEEDTKAEAETEAET